MIYVTIIIIALGTWLTRSLPFIILKKQKLSAKALNIIDSLPFATISLLVVYSLKDSMSSHFLPALIATSWLIFIHRSFKNAILSIFSSTLLYMILIHVI